MEKPFQKPPKIAVEWRDEIYYGDTKTDGIIGTKNKAGTNYACEYATVSIVNKDQAFAIAIIHVTVRTTMDMVSRLLKIIETHGIKVKLFLHTRNTGRSNAYSVP